MTRDICHKKIVKRININKIQDSKEYIFLLSKQIYLYYPVVYVVSYMCVCYSKSQFEFYVILKF